MLQPPVCSGNNLMDFQMVRSICKVHAIFILSLAVVTSDYPITSSILSFSMAIHIFSCIYLNISISIWQYISISIYIQVSYVSQDTSFYSAKELLKISTLQLGNEIGNKTRSDQKIVLS